MLWAAPAITTVRAAPAITASPGCVADASNANAQTILAGNSHQSTPGAGTSGIIDAQVFSGSETMIIAGASTAPLTGSATYTYTWSLTVPTASVGDIPQLTFYNPEGKASLSVSGPTVELSTNPDYPADQFSTITYVVTGTTTTDLDPGATSSPAWSATDPSLDVQYTWTSSLNVDPTLDGTYRVYSESPCQSTQLTGTMASELYIRE